MRYLLLPLLILCAVPFTAFAAIARDTSAIGAAGAVLSNTDSYTVGASATLLIVFHIYNTDSDTGTESQATWNGVNMTRITGLNGVQAMLVCGGSICYRMGGWYMVNPTTGTHNVFTGASQTEFQQAYIYSYTGTATDATAISASDHTSSGGSNVTSISSNIAVPAATNWVVALGVANSGVGSSLTTSGVVSKLSSDNSMASIIMDSNGTVAASSDAYGIGGAVSGSLGVFAVSIAPASAAAPLLNSIIGLVHAFFLR